MRRHTPSHEKKYTDGPVPINLAYSTMDLVQKLMRHEWDSQRYLTRLHGILTCPRDKEIIYTTLFLHSTISLLQVLIKSVPFEVYSRGVRPSF